MALANVEEAVLKKAKAEARQVEADARAEAEAFWEKESARMREDHARRVETTRQEYEDKLERDTGDRKAADNRKLLKIKNEIIAEVFSQALAGVLNLRDGGYAQWVKARVAGLPELPGTKLAGNERDQALLQEAAAARTDLSISAAPVPLQGGFMVIGTQADLDFSIESLMDTLRESLTHDVATRLFGEGEA